MRPRLSSSSSKVSGWLASAARSATRCADTTRRPGTARMAATIDCPSTWLASTTGRPSSWTWAPASRIATRSAASPQWGNRFVVAPAGSSPATTSTISTRARRWSTVAWPARPGGPAVAAPTGGRRRACRAAPGDRRPMPRARGAARHRAGGVEPFDLTAGPGLGTRRDERGRRGRRSTGTTASGPRRAAAPGRAGPTGRAAAPPTTPEPGTGSGGRRGRRSPRHHAGCVGQRAPRRCSTASWSTRTAPWLRSPAASASNSSNADRSASRSA